MSTMLKKEYSKTKPVCKVTFNLPLEAAQGGKEVRIIGDFNEWSWENGYRMKAGKAEFSTSVELTAGKTYQFRYLIDNHIWENDWNADSYEVTPFGVYNSVLSLVEAKAAKPAAAPKVEAPKVAAPKAAVATKPATKTAAPKAVAAPKAAVKAVAPKVATAPKAKPAAPKAAAKPAAKATAPKGGKA